MSFKYEQSTNDKETIYISFDFQDKEKMPKLAALIEKAGGNKWEKHGKIRVYFPNRIVEAVDEQIGVGFVECYLDLSKGSLESCCHKDYLDKVLEFKELFIDELKATLKANS